MSEKPYKPSRRRIEDARKKGDIPRSQLLTSTAALLGAAVGLVCSLNWIAPQLLFFLQVALDPSVSSRVCLSLSADILLKALASVLLPAAVAGLAIEIYQVGFHPNPEVLPPQLSRCDAMQGIVRIGGGVKKFPLALLKVTLSLWMGLVLCSRIIGAVPQTELSFPGVVALFEEQLPKVALCALVLLVVFALIELLSAHKQFLKRHSMTIDEVKRENKEQEGDPLIKQRRKALHQAMMMQDVVSRVRRAKVIVVKRS